MERDSTILLDRGRFDSGRSGPEVSAQNPDSSMSSPPSEATKVKAEPDRDSITPSNGVMIAILVLFAACLGVAFRDFFLLQYHYATVEAADWGHTLFIPLIALYVVLLHKADLFERTIVPSKLGFLLVALGILWYAGTWLTPDSTFLNSHNVRAIGVFLALLGITVGLLGWRSLIWLWFPLLYIFVFGQRITDKVLLELTLPMQSIAAWGSWHALDLVGYDLLPLRGNYIVVLLPGGEEYPLDVAEACSGMRMLMAFLALGTVIAYVGLDRWPLRLILITAGLPIAIFINVLRICTLGILGMNGEGFMFGEFHSLVGLAWMIPTFGLFMLLMWFLRPLDEDEDGNRLRRGAGSAETRDAKPPRFEPRVKTIGLGLAMVLLLGGVVVSATIEGLGIHLVKKQVPPRSPVDGIPDRIGDWVKYGEDEVFADTLIEVLGTSRYLQRYYALNGDPAEGMLQLHLAYYTDLAGTAPHVPEICWENHGLISVREPFELDLDLRLGGAPTQVENRATGIPYQTIPRTDPVTGERLDLPLPVGDYALRTTIFTSPERPSLRNFGGYLFIANGRTTSSAMAVENVAFDLTSEYAYYCKIQLNATMASMSEADDEENLERFEALSTDFLESLIPAMTEVLPDWREYEGKADSDEG